MITFPVAVEHMGELAFAQLGPGGLSIGHRPAKKALPRLAEAGVTHVATVLSEREGAAMVGAAAKEAGLGWIWLPLGSTRVLPARGAPDVAAVLDTMEETLSEGGKLYLHCSAGMHRTGMIAAALLFRLGGDADAVRAAVEAMRRVTGEAMGEHRLDWASSFVRRAR